MSLALAALGNAGTLARENFDTYPAGSLAGKGAADSGWAAGWAAGPLTTVAAEVIDTSVAGALDVSPVGGAPISGGSRALDIYPPAGVGSGGQFGIVATRQLAAPLQNTFYVGYVIKWQSGNFNTNDTLALHLTDDPADETSGFNFGYRGQAGTFGVVARKGTGNPVAGAFSNISGTTNIRYLVAKIEKAGATNFNRITVWVDPSSSSEASLPNGDLQLTADSGIASITSLNLRVETIKSPDAGANGNDRIRIDSLAVATDFADLMSNQFPPSGPLPDPLPILYQPPPVNIIASDDFNPYAAGNLAGQGGSNYGWTGPWAAGAGGGVTMSSSATSVFIVPDGGALVGGGRSVDFGGSGSGIPVTRGLSVPQTGTFYVGCLIRVNSNPNTNDIYTVGLGNSPTDTATGFNFGLRGEPGGAKHHYFVRKGITGTPTGPLASLSGAILDPRYLVVKVQKTGGGNYNKVTGWINPGIGSETNKPAGDMQILTDLGISSISQVILRASGVDSGDKCTLDSLTLAKNFADLMAPARPGPDERPSVNTLRVEPTANGSIDAALSSPAIASGTAVTGYAIVRDSSGGFVSNSPMHWTLTEITGAVSPADLMPSADGKSATFRGNGAGTARIVAIGNATSIYTSGVIQVLPRTNLYPRPFIWTRMSERDSILSRIRDNGIATAQFIRVKNRADAAVAYHSSDRDGYLRQLPLSTSTGEPRFNLISTANDDVVQKLYNSGIDCAAMYHLTGQVAYARCAADTLHNSLLALLNLPVSTDNSYGGWLFSNGLLGETSAVGEQLPIIYDFINDWLKAGNTVYQLGTTGGSEVAFSFTNAQAVFRKYFQLARDRGQANNNWSANMATCLVHNALALDSDTERATSLLNYLSVDTSRQSSLQTDATKYPNPGDIWPETLSYSSAVNNIHPRLMVLLERYDPSLDLFGTYPNVAMGMARPYQFIYPNGHQIHFGDFHDADDYEVPYFEYETVYRHAVENNIPSLRALYGPLIKDGIATGKYSRYGDVKDDPRLLFWFADEVTEAPLGLNLPRTDTLSHAGIALQRNLSSTGDPKDGLMAFVGGGAHVHSHANGMNMELYGEGAVLGADAGKGDYQTPLHENYYRLFAAHNTVIVNGASRGEGGWADIAINTVGVVAMEPQASQPAVSPDLSFTCTSFLDDKGTQAEATQQRTLGIIRTSPTTGYYVDIFRSKSTLPNQFHDYLYHNPGSGPALTQTNGTALAMTSQPNRFQSDIGDAYQQPGWRYFTNITASSTYTQNLRGRFTATINSVATYMDLHIPGATGREYARADTPAILPAPAPYDSQDAPVLAIRQTGEAWDRPFALVFEPHQGAATSGTVQSVTKLEKAGVLVGLKVESSVAGNNLVQYVLSNVGGSDNYTDGSIGLSFTGRYAVVTVRSDGSRNFYLGEGSSLSCGGITVASQSGGNTGANVDILPGQAPVITANSAVTVTSQVPPVISDAADLSVAVNTAIAPVAFTVSDDLLPASSLVVTASSSNPALVSAVASGSGSNRSVALSATANQLGSSTITVTVSDGSLAASDSFVVNITGTAIQTWRFANFATTAAAGNASDSANPDGDAWTNAQEYVFGGNPNSPDTGGLHTATTQGGSILLSFTATIATGPGYAGLTRFFDVETTTDLTSTGSWEVVPGYGNVAGAGQTVQISEPALVGPRFYRLKVRLIP